MGSIDSNLLKAIEKLLRWAKTVFQRREKHKHECNQACYPTKDPNNMLNSKKISQQEKCKAFRSKTHTHTHIQWV